LITLKRYLEVDHSGVLKSTLDSYRAAVAATSTFGSQASPCLGPEFVQSLTSLAESLAADPTAEAVAETEQRFETELQQAGERASDYLKQKTTEIKELIVVIASTAEAMGERDHRYSAQFHDFSARLQAIANLDDLTKIRQSLVQSAQELKSYVDQMARETQECVKQLRTELSASRAREEATERLASRDPLTGLGNRRRVEMELEHYEEQKKLFCIMMFDVNGFKQINDGLGHVAGDQVLKQFATELKAVFRPTDFIGRWGGDEFVAILDCELKQAESQIARIRQWVFGEYEIVVGGVARKVGVSAAIGVAAANSKEPFAKVIERADAAMYKDKARSAPPVKK
jgi:diguanylate cyclase (GGDEF)-like protein